MNKHIRLLFKFLIFIVGLWLVVANQKTIGYANLAGMCVGLGMLLSLLYMYNKQF